MNNQIPSNSIGFRNNLLKARDFSAGKEAGYFELSSTQGVKDVLCSVPTALGKIDTVLMINIDHFDYVNQRFGFDVGDVQVATLAVGSSRSSESRTKRSMVSAPKVPT